METMCVNSMEQHKRQSYLHKYANKITQYINYYVLQSGE